MLYDERTYEEYLRWYVPKTRSRLNYSPPERPTTVIQSEQLMIGMDRHRASRRDDTVLIFLYSWEYRTIDH